MPTADKSLFYYGSIYHALLDPPLAESRQVAVGLVPEGSSVLDIGCGTGQLCLALRAKDCRVVGVDRSARMLRFARESSPYPDVTFLHADGRELADFRAETFDYATVLMVLHELPLQDRVKLLREALRVATKVMVIDSVTPLPRNGAAVGIRLVERVLGYDHNPNFKAFLAEGGIRGALRESSLATRVEHTSVFWHGCREVVLFARDTSSLT